MGFYFRTGDSPMTKPLNSNFITQKNKQQNQPVYLYTLINYDGAGSNLNFAAWDSDVVYQATGESGSTTYTRFPIQHQYTSSNSNAQVDIVSVTIGNVSRFIQSYLEKYDIRGCMVRIRSVFIDQLSDQNCFSDEIYSVDSYAADDMNVNLNLSSKIDVMAFQLPYRIFMRDYCSWNFKGTECGYSGPDSICLKTAADCKARTGGSNFIRFGGFPSVPTENIQIA